MQKGVNVFEYYDEEKRKALLDVSAADPDKEVAFRNIVAGVLVAVAIGAVMFLIMDDAPQNRRPRAASASSTQTRAPSFTASQKDMATSAIEQYPEVINSRIGQSGMKLSLVLIVFPTTSISRAKQLGDSFVRMVKTFSPDTSPGKLIGQGRYDYMIGVYYPNEQQVALGAKVGGARSLSW